MPEETVVTEQHTEAVEHKTVYDSGLSLQEFRDISNGVKIPKQTESATETKPDGELSEAEQAKTAAVTETTDQEAQEKKNKSNKSAEARIDQYYSRWKATEDKLAKVSRKLEEFEQRERQSAQPKPADQPKPDAVTQPSKDDDPKPKPKEYLDKHETYEDGLEAYEDARHAWEKRQAQKEQSKRDTQKQEAENAKRINERIKDIREKHENWDETGAKLALSPVMRDFAVEDDQGLDVIQFLAENPEEYERITQITNPVKLVAAMGRIARSLEPTPEKTTRTKPVSAAPAPPRTVTGTEAVTSANHLDPDEAKRLTNKQWREREDTRLSRRGT